MPVIYIAILITLFSMGCALETEEPKGLDISEENVSKPRTQSKYTVRTTNIFKQDINKSYSSINRPWVLAKPLGIDSEVNASDFFDE